MAYYSFLYWAMFLRWVNVIRLFAKHRASSTTSTYFSLFSIAADSKLRAVVVFDGYRESAVFTFQYWIKPCWKETPPDISSYGKRRCYASSCAIERMTKWSWGNYFLKRLAPEYQLNSAKYKPCCSDESLIYFLLSKILVVVIQQSIMFWARFVLYICS